MRLCCCQKSATNVEPPVDMLPTIDLKQGQVVGTTKTRDGKRISIYNDIPFAKCSRFQRPEVCMNTHYYYLTTVESVQNI